MMDVSSAKVKIDDVDVTGYVGWAASTKGSMTGIFDLETESDVAAAAVRAIKQWTEQVNFWADVDTLQRLLSPRLWAEDRRRERAHRDTQAWLNTRRTSRRHGSE